MISILGDYTYDFPKKLTLKHKLKDLLDKNVDEKYYLSQQHIEQIQSWGGYENPLKDIEKEKSIIGTLTTHCGKESNGMKLVSEGEYIAIKNNTKQGYLLAEEGDGIDISGRMKTHRGTVQKETCQTLTTAAGQRETDNFVVVDLKRGYSCEIKEEKEDVEGVEIIGNYSKSNFNQTSIVNKNGIAPTITENHGQVTAIAIKNNTKQGYLLAEEGDAVDISGRMEWHRGTVQKENCQTLTTGGDNVGVVVRDSYVGIYNFSKSDNFMGDRDRFQANKETANTILTTQKEGVVLSEEPFSVKNELRIRKLTPCECIKLMGFERKDYESLVEYGLSDSAIYHCAGDSIVATVLVGLFGTMTNKDYEQIIKDYVERIAND